MIKYTGYSVVMQEVPDEISLAIEISNCPIGAQAAIPRSCSRTSGTILNEISPRYLKNTKDGLPVFVLWGRGTIGMHWFGA